MKRIKVIELFAGYGSQHLALKRLKRHFPQFDYEVVAFCEIDKYAIKAYQALHGENIPNLGDVTKVDAKSVPDCDLMTWSYPCTDISSAGKQAGLEEGSGTASSLCWDAIRIFEAKKPKYLLMENVPALLSKKFEGDFKTIRERLEGLGYTNYYQTLNAKNYGVPQNRNRVFMVSILDDHQPYHFPKPFPLERRLKDVLEQDVDERYYLNNERVQGLLKSTEKENGRGNGFAFKPKTAADEYAGTIQTSAGNRKTDNFIAEPKVQCVGSLNPSDDWHGSIRQRHKVYSTDGCRPTLDTAQGGGLIPKIVERQLSPRQQSIRVHQLPNGNIRCYQDDDRKTGVSELQFTHPDNLSPTVTTQGSIKTIVEQQVLGWTRDKQGNVVDRHSVEVANCVTAGKRDNTQNYVQTIISTPHGYFKGAERSDVAPTCKASAMQEQHFVKEQHLLNGDSEGNASTITTANHYSGNITNPKGGHKEMGVLEHSSQIRIRKLTERELFRLMDVDEADIDILLNAGISNTQLAKLAGNSIVVNVLYHIFRTMFVETEREVESGEQLTLF